MKNTQYINIQGWMVNELKLKSNELIAYAVIYGFSQDGDSKFTGSLKYLESCLGVSKNTVLNAIKGLIEKGFISKETNTINNIKFCSYSHIELVVQNLVQGSAKIAPGGSAKTAPNNTTINNTNIYNSEHINNFEPIKENETIKPIENKLTEEHFLQRWSDARKRFDNMPTNIKKLTTFEKVDFNELKKDYNKTEFDQAIQGLFQQETFPKTRLRPSHFLRRENFETYLTCFTTKEVLFKKQQKYKKPIERI